MTMRARGFTLIELLVALFITAIMMAMGYAAVNQAATGRVSVEKQTTRILQVQRALRTLEQDIELLAPRPVRDPLGGDNLAALVVGSTASLSAAATGAAAGASGSSSGSVSSASGSTASGTTSTASSLALQATALLALTRGGWANPVGVPRPEEQRVSYQLEAGKLVRYHQPVLDAVGETPLVRRELLDDVTSIRFRFMDAGHNWQENWQLTGRTRQTLRFRPVAIEVTLVLKDYGTLVRVVEIAG
jgi:general secretion pathway protein J